MLESAVGAALFGEHTQSAALPPPAAASEQPASSACGSNAYPAHASDATTLERTVECPSPGGVLMLTSQQGTQLVSVADGGLRQAPEHAVHFGKECGSSASLLAAQPDAWLCTSSGVPEPDAAGSSGSYFPGVPISLTGELHGNPVDRTQLERSNEGSQTSERHGSACSDNDVTGHVGFSLGCGEEDNSLRLLLTEALTSDASQQDPTLDALISVLEQA